MVRWMIGWVNFPRIGSKADGPRLPQARGGILLLALVMSWSSAGCIPVERKLGADDPPLLPLSGAARAPDEARAGRQAASFQLTIEGRTHLREGRLAEAMDRFQKAIALFSSNPYAYYYFGEARYLRKEYDQSLPLLDRAELFMSDSLWQSKVSVLRGKNYEALFRYEEAWRHYQQALAKDPRNLEAQEAILRLQAPSAVQ